MSSHSNERLWSHVSKLPHPANFWNGVRLNHGLLPDNILIFSHEYTQPPPPTTIGSYHPRYVFDVILRGRGYVQIGSDCFLLEEGEAFLIFPHQYHFGGSEKPGVPFGLLVTTFDLENDQSVVASLKASPRRLRGQDHTHLSALVEAWKAAADGVQLAALLARCLKSLAEAPPVKRRKVKSPVDPRRNELLETIIQLQDGGAGDTVTELAAAMKIGEAALRDRFRQYVGQGLPEFLRRRRLQRAVRLLEQQNLSIGEIASQLRYSSIQTFSRIFKEHFGVSPKEYQTAVQRNLSSKQP